MLFNSYLFIFVFMPIAVSGFYFLSSKNHKYAISWLGILSLFFYAYWSLKSLPILIFSILFNFSVGRYLTTIKINYRNYLLFFAIFLNLFILGYFKYTNFFIDIANEFNNAEKIRLLNISLPIGISFFTFTQIAYLMDSHQGKVRENSLINYILFVSFFPHLIAGPILHHKQMMPQFSDINIGKKNYQTLFLGLLLFTIGLGKKILVADNLAIYVDNFYLNLKTNEFSLGFNDAWLSSFSYTFQLYFDFSGYTDMALGLALLFGILMPINFNSPFKSTSIIEFWQRWHISLTKYINEYLYVPMTLRILRFSHGSSKNIEFFYSVLLPPLIIFSILGLWHGANWTFVLFGIMHGVYIVLNHLWRRYFKFFSIKNNKNITIKNLQSCFYWLLTFLVVNLSFVMFRSETVENAISIYRKMSNFHDASMLVIDFRNSILVLICFILVLSFPNSNNILNSYKSMQAGNNEKYSYLKFYFYPMFLGFVFILSIVLLDKPSSFLYFQF